MPLFSQRQGIRPLAKTIQRESIDSELRNQLWSALNLTLWDKWSPRDEFSGIQTKDSRHVEIVMAKLWIKYFKLPIDTVPPFRSKGGKSAYGEVRSYFFDEEWWRCYDLLEFLIKNVPDDWRGPLKDFVNGFLQQESAAYRVVGDEIVEITDKLEVDAVETALDRGIRESKTHLARALELLSDKKQPDYRNSIKESISAVESACKVFSGKKKATLGNCVKAIRDTGTMHPAFEESLLKLYGYTSDEGGIRHALTEDSNDPSFADAKFMLVSCASFVNFLWTKAAEANISISES